MMPIYKIQVPGWPEGAWLDYGKPFRTEKEARESLERYQREWRAIWRDNEWRLIKFEIMDEHRI